VAGRAKEWRTTVLMFVVKGWIDLRLERGGAHSSSVSFPVNGTIGRQRNFLLFDHCFTWRPPWVHIRTLAFRGHRFRRVDALVLLLQMCS
jgi:hypothetical protein